MSVQGQGTQPCVDNGKNSEILIKEIEELKREKKEMEAALQAEKSIRSQAEKVSGQQRCSDKEGYGCTSVVILASQTRAYPDLMNMNGKNVRNFVCESDVLLWEIWMPPVFMCVVVDMYSCAQGSFEQLWAMWDHLLDGQTKSSVPNYVCVSNHYTFVLFCQLLSKSVQNYMYCQKGSMKVIPIDDF